RVPDDGGDGPRLEREAHRHRRRVDLLRLPHPRRGRRDELLRPRQRAAARVRSQGHPGSDPHPQPRAARLRARHARGRSRAPPGAEMAGGLSELCRLVLVKDYPRLNVKDVRVLLLEATDRLLAAMPARLRDAAAETLWRKHVEVRFGATVADYDGARVLLKSG